MTLEEEKYLLLGDLCARLPYGVIGKCEVDASYDTSFDTIFQYHRFNAELDGINGDLVFVTPLIDDKDELEYTYEEVADGIDIFEFKPYLRPLKSMTEEEKKEIEKITNNTFYVNSNYIANFKPTSRNWDGNWHSSYINYPLTNVECNKLISWLDKNHFDHRTDEEGKTLIEKGLAIEVTEENNPYKE